MRVADVDVCAGAAVCPGASCAADQPAERPQPRRTGQHRSQTIWQSVQQSLLMRRCPDMCSLGEGGHSTAALWSDSCIIVMPGLRSMLHLCRHGSRCQRCGLLARCCRCGCPGGILRWTWHLESLFKATSCTRSCSSCGTRCIPAAPAASSSSAAAGDLHVTNSSLRSCTLDSCVLTGWPKSLMNRFKRTRSATIPVFRS